MIEFQTNIIKEALSHPSKLDFSQIIAKRQRQLTNKERYVHKIREAGRIGEETVIDYLKQYGKMHWIYIRNMWLEDFGLCENDITLITNSHCYVFEVKNYEQNYSHCDGICFVNDKRLKNSPVAQTRKNFINLKNICSEFSPNIQVKGALIMTNIDQKVDIQSTIEDIEVVPRNSIREYIKKIVNEEHNATNTIDDKEGLIQYFEQYEIINPNLPSSLGDDAFASLRKGIYCGNCGSFNLNFNSRKKYINCDCGFHEPREEAILRTICEYGF